MEYISFNRVLPEIASTETRTVTYLETIPGGPSAGKYYFMEMLGLDLFSTMVIEDLISPAMHLSKMKDL